MPGATILFPKSPAPMDTQRLIALIVFFASSFLLWDAWQKTQHPILPKPGLQQAQPTTIPTPSVTGDKAPAAIASVTQAPVGLGASGDRIRVSTDLLIAEIDTTGGDLRHLELTRHFAADDRTKHLILLQDDAKPLFLVQTGLIGPALPNHTTRFVAKAGAYSLAPAQSQIDIRLTAPAGGAVQVDKIYTFHRGTYVIDVRYEVKNTGSVALEPSAYFQFLRDGSPPPGDPRFISTFTGPAVYTNGSKFQKVAFADIDKGKTSYPAKAKDGWLGIVQHYFVTAWLPDLGTATGVEREFFTKKISEQLYAAGVILPLGKIEPGSTAQIKVPMYAGPQEAEELKRLAPGLELTVDYGWLTIIATPLFWVLSTIHGWVGNWGVAIILLTVMIKLLFFPLSAASYRSMARMRVVAPKLQKLKEQYGDDRQKLHQAMMELYKTEKINPLGGCLPVAVQIPVFIALYWVLLGAVELRHAPFILWIHDLSAQDPYYILPIIMGISMLVQTKLNPKPPDPIQAKVMMIMPFAFSIFFFFFPAGLVLYWVVNNVLSITQQWQITRMIEGAAKKGNAKR